jgi:hypothetical protein
LKAKGKEAMNDILPSLVLFDDFYDGAHRGPLDTARIPLCKAFCNAVMGARIYSIPLCSRTTRILRRLVWPSK